MCVSEVERRLAVSVPYTQGVWRVKTGRADEFVAAWIEFAQWTAANANGSGRAYSSETLR